ncbi:MAG TPA: response regulator [Silvibacterium sp.]|jgi:CheY-like chemotaxis protein|nr:response regulator [Silvibacterium sp.]
MPVDVLLVDDDAVQAATRKAILNQAGHSVAVAADGQAALRFLDTQEGSLVRLVLTDHLMPGMNGVEFVDSLRKAGYLLPVLVLSGYADAEEEYASLDVSFRVKPFPPDQLTSLVHFLLAAAERRTA